MVVDLTLACTEYDWTRPLWNGDVEPEGVDLHLVDYHNPERFSRMVKNQEFDMCEMSWGSYLSSLAHKDDFPFTAIPVFPYRKFRHSFIYKRSGDDLQMSDLNGKDVGLIHWQTTTAVWQRGIAKEHYGVDLESITWHTTKSEGDIIPIDIPERFDVEHSHRPGSTSEILASMLKEEEIDAAFYTGPLSNRVTTGRHDKLEQSGERKESGVEKIFEDSMKVEEKYYRETSIFPLMHTVVISDEVLENYPWVANKMYNAFERALQLCMNRLTKPRWFPLAWSNQHVTHQREVMGENPWEYGLTDENIIALEKLQEYAQDHGLISNSYGLEELFVESTLD